MAKSSSKSSPPTDDRERLAQGLKRAFPVEAFPVENASAFGHLLRRIDEADRNVRR